MQTKKRKDSFLGIHSDFHATPAFGTVGATLREEEIREVCRLLKPDFWEIDSKGHPGWASYPTALGNAMPSIAFDTLAMWRRVTREEGVALYLHYSGLWDINYGTQHPEECVVNADGSIRIGVIRPIGADLKIGIHTVNGIRVMANIGMKFLTAKSPVFIIIGVAFGYGQPTV